MESVGRLAGGGAHDFKIMLGVILGHTELVLMKDPDTNVKESLLEIQNAAKRSADLTRQLLAFARKQTISPEVTDLNDVVEDMLKMLRRLIGEDIDLKWHPGQDLDLIMIDPSQIDQILANLCVNARDAITGNGNIIIETLNVHFDEGYCAIQSCIPGNYVQLSVMDDGCGMSDDVKARLFEPFFTTKELGKGTGLGLATVYGTVKQSNGFVNVYSEKGHGTVFKIYFPSYDGEEIDVKPQHQENGNTLPDCSLGHETVLIVEDEEMILEITMTMLKRQGYNVITARTPLSAIDIASGYDGQIDLLITDVVMPEMNGRDLSKALYSLYPNIKTLFMSGYTANVIAHHGVLDEGVNFLQKPFSINGLINAVQKALTGKSGQAK
jgi:CheY-like chemotaxis protein